MKRSTSFVIILLLAQSIACLTQTLQDASALIEASISSADLNAKDALYYTFHEDDSNIVPDILGTPPMPKLPGTQWMIPVFTVNSEYRWSIQLDVLFIEGIPYRRLIGINNQKLPPELMTFESQKYDRAVATIHTLSPQQRQQRLVSPEDRPSLYIDPKQFRSFYSCKATGHEKVDKRSSTIVRCKPLNKLQESNTAQASGEVTLWVDEQRPFFHRMRLVLDHTLGQYGRGTTFTDTWSLIDGVWHETSAELDWVGAATFSKNIETPAPTPGFANNVEQTNRGKEIITFSNFKKFRTESRILNP
ncbi:MAG TPA: hypothetical protein VK578_07680 [Edaphobacter sp.]|nr:hypothetical protein [Edaphobacter sp.]